MKWYAEIRADECAMADKFLTTHHGTARKVGKEPMAPRLPKTSCHDDHVHLTWVPDTTIEFDLHNWEPTGYDPAIHLILHSDIPRRQNHSDIELSELMREPLEIQFLAMFAYVSFLTPGSPKPIFIMGTSDNWIA